ncbi:hypothetical protein J437_LFUL010685, partial [Ladona fulva]
MELRPALSPDKVMTDFERAHMNRLMSLFPNASLSCCLFHLGQSIYRKVMELGFKERYNTDVHFSLKVRCIIALAFLPIEDVVDGFEELGEDDDIPHELLSYFEINYLGCVRGRGQRRRRGTPYFPMEMWNMNSRTISNMPRTNNSVEASHKALQTSLVSAHPSIWKLISKIREEESYARIKLMELNQGETEEKKAYKNINNRLKHLIQNYD